MTEQEKKAQLENNVTLRHNLIALPRGDNGKEKKPTDVVGERHEMVLLIEVIKSNPNGDPDTGNMPRMQPDTLKGLITDVCLKRKIRNFFSLYMPDGEVLADSSTEGYRIFIRENAVLQQLMESDDIAETAEMIFSDYYEPRKGEWKRPAKGKTGENEYIVRSFRDALCRTFFDVRAFGGVTSTEGPMKSSFYGQIRGPIQFSFSESLDRILQLDFSITRCASTSEKEKKQMEKEGQTKSVEESGHRTMGRKYLVDYGIYRSRIYLSPAFAARTKFTYYDLDNFLFALKHMFTDDKAAPRTGMSVVGLVDFQHSTALGNEHAHKLFKMVEVRRADVGENDKPVKEFPQSIADYCGKAPDGAVRQKDEGGEGKALVTARKLIWEIPACPKTK